METYWVSLLVQDTETSKPWLAAMTSPEVSLENAIAVLNRGKENYRTLSAWIDVFDENNNFVKTAFHNCYLNPHGITYADSTTNGF